MFDSYQWTLHALTLRQLADAEQIADVIGVDAAEAAQNLERAVADGAVIGARGSFMLTPAGRAVLDPAYPEAFADLRADPAVTEAFDQFEDRINPQLLKVTTDWQTVEVDGERVPNPHTDPAYDTKVIRRIGDVHERAGQVLQPIVDAEPHLKRFLDRLGQALLRAEGGETDYVSGVKVDSYHTVWFQLHEHLLRLLGRERRE